MNREEALNRLRPHLSEKRYNHTVRVLDTALELSTFYEVNRKETELAAIFHDYFKERDVSEMKSIIINSDLSNHLLNFHHELWHGPVAAYKLESELGIESSRIKEAIYYHTTGKANMSMLDKIIYLADYIEPGRQFDGIEDVRNEAFRSLDSACFMAVRNSIRHLLDLEQLIYPETLNMYNDLKRKLEESHSE
ncbi:putative HD superfamily hydrolase of NAD metabolism [Pelagirhabdus alkalitolerans]|uniref:bis(5'-nucleosyl)-tetraphosphatase (symmetrical) n=1 Tax=Pelagirhabdus alkalitolerans TaxID=1612202 RepID=A0A1G6HTX1_9BACI|nr:bis(5'-nucleosyl)-tetraphosphatase (symmetrical) YqeK [Pelagirhabdus alkalitolerans]SDB97598.1 putative HD superfamily hydrolase of NAD metabolism [Pelagirhabdus alkalitolerans]